ncbi:uncharacterized protein SPPG_04979 [Spizellomyces punctatus DAOM BR117]|uniref:SH3 domain-containing protein n=1 Tax=Spizellomyces punctatus (strain DAOM BR117) TaxID=645134 RepID=A0A0L0HEU3_SPIPD|nr:uncharacterized protein SPPG_04979 [Spizellomyces punctatus DAOM BR117]KNC99592.1 hypothetical protein SPPG_04979 [Spizellomyces punctatus DAOM BR117]|eukprot:XP_016607632.1 hypothetical protein SPPG_04979 [Spizellomyces punctatus DAOM BR117]
MVAVGVVVGIVLGVVCIFLFAFVVHQMRKGSKTIQSDTLADETTRGHDTAEKGLVEHGTNALQVQDRSLENAPRSTSEQTLSENESKGKSELVSLTLQKSVQPEQSIPRTSIDRSRSPINRVRTPTSPLSQVTNGTTLASDDDRRSITTAASSITTRKNSTGSVVLRASVDLPRRTASLEANAGKGGAAAIVAPRLLGTQLALHWFRRKVSDEITVKAGDPMSIYQTYRDGWCLGMNWRSGQSGVFPLAAISPEEAQKLASEYPEPDAPPTDSPLPSITSPSPVPPPSSPDPVTSSLLYSLNLSGAAPNASHYSLTSSSVPSSTHWGVRELKPRGFRRPSVDRERASNSGRISARPGRPDVVADPEVSDLAAVYLAAMDKMDDESNVLSPIYRDSYTSLQTHAERLAISLNSVSPHPVASSLQKQAGKLVEDISVASKEIASEIPKDPKRASRMSIPEARKSVLQLHNEVTKFFDEVFTDTDNVPPVPPIPDFVRRVSGDAQQDDAEGSELLATEDEDEPRRNSFVNESNDGSPLSVVSGTGPLHPSSEDISQSPTHQAQSEKVAIPEDDDADDDIPLHVIAEQANAVQNNQSTPEIADTADRTSAEDEHPKMVEVEEHKALEAQVNDDNGQHDQQNEDAALVVIDADTQSEDLEQPAGAEPLAVITATMADTEPEQLTQQIDDQESQILDNEPPSIVKVETASQEPQSKIDDHLISDTTHQKTTPVLEESILQAPTATA